MLTLQVNGQPVQVDAEAEMPLLWVLRELLGLRGTKFGCGIGQCGACTVHLDGVAARSCSVPVGAVGERAVTTIEGLGTPAEPHPVQRAWLAHQVPQCGYCQPGMQMAAAAFLGARDTPEPPSREEIDAHITNVCRCGCYDRIRTAIRTAGAS